MKQRNRKILTLLLALVMVMSVFAGCNENTDSKDEEVVTETNEETQEEVQQESENEVDKEVTMDVIEVWSNNAHSKVQDIEMVEEFNNTIGKEKGIQIDYKVYGGDYNNVIQVAISAGQAPHMYKMANVDIGSLSKSEAIVAVNDLPGGEEFLTKYEGMLDPVDNQYDGKTYTVPFAKLAAGVAYNKELLAKNGFNEPPKTWDELRNMAKVVTDNGGGKEFGFIEGLKGSGISKWNGLFHNVASVGHTGFDFSEGKFSYIDFAPFFDTLYQMKAVDKSWFPGAEGLNNDAARARFAEGVVAFKMSASWDVAVWADQFPTTMEWGVCRPVEDVNNRYKDYTYNTFYYFLGNKALELPEKTFEVYKLFNSDEMVKKLYEEAKNLPYKQDIYDMVESTPTDPNWIAMGELSNASSYPYNPITKVNYEGDDLNIVIQKILGGVETAEEAFTDLDKRLNEALQKEIDKGLDINQFLSDMDARVN